MALAFLVAGCAAADPNPALASLNAQATLEDVQAVGEADIGNRDWNVPNWYRQSIYVSPSISSWFFSDGRSGSYAFIYTGLLAAFILFVIMFFVYMTSISEFRYEYFWIVTGLSVAAIPLLSFGSSALSGSGVPWHFSMFCVFAIGAVAPLLFLVVRGVPAFAVSVFSPIAKASKRRADKAAQRRKRREQAQVERQALAEQAQRETQRRKRNKEVSVHEKLRNVELAVGELCLCAELEKTAMERELLHTVMELTGYEKVIRADREALTNIRNVIVMLDRLGYDKDQIVYLKLVSLVR